MTEIRGRKEIQSLDEPSLPDLITRIEGGEALCGVGCADCLSHYYPLSAVTLKCAERGKGPEALP